MVKILDKIIVWGIAILAFVVPLFFLPLTTDFYDFNKNLFLILITLLLLMLWIFKLAVSPQIKLVKTPLDVPMIFFGLAFGLSTIFASANKIEALLDPGATGTIIALVLLYFIITNNLAKEGINLIKKALIGSGLAISLIAIFQFTGLTETITQIAWLKSRTWTPAGAPMIVIMFLAIILPLIIAPFVKNFVKTANPAAVGRIFGTGLVALLVLVGLILTIFQAFPLIILPYQTSWQIAVESFKQNPLFGVGPQNFITAFNRFRTIGFNSYDFWNIRFGSASNYPLHLLTTTGILGLLSFAWLAVRSLKEKPKSQNVPLYISVIVPLLFLIALPANFLILFCFFILLALLSLSRETSLDEVQANKQPWVTRILFVASFFLFASSAYLGSRAFAAEVYYKQSLDALAKNQGIPTYNLQIKAIGLNPKKTSFRIAYSQTNLALANALSAKKDLSDQDRANITKLVQQAINDAKTATALAPDDSASWENLAQVYRSIINFAQGADQWAATAYQQAIITDPVNPRMRLNLGGFYFSLGQYDQAIRFFQDSANLKPDYANAYYNLAAAYQEQKKYPEAYSSLLNAVNLVPADSSDYQKAKTELDELAKKLPSTTPATPSAKAVSKPEEALTQPEPLPSPIEPPIELSVPTQEAIPTTQPNP